MFPIPAPKPLDYTSLQAAEDSSAYKLLPYPSNACFSPPRAAVYTNLSVASADRTTPSLVDSSSSVSDAIPTVDATTCRIAIAEDAFDLHSLDKMEAT